MSRTPTQKRPKLTVKQEREAYAAATDRDYGTGSGFGQCQRCGLWGLCDRDHRQNRDAWNTTVANLQLLGSAFGCGCHIWKTENPAKAIKAGFSVPSWADPAEWPAKRHGVGWVLYYDAPVNGAWWKPITEEQARALMAGEEEHRDPDR